MTDEQPRVFVAHPVLVRTDSGMRWKFDIERIVREYGQLISVLDNSSIMLTYDVALVQIEHEFRRQQFNPDSDYFLAAGDMTAFGAMLLVSAETFGGTPRQLRHSQRLDRYDVLPRWRRLTTIEEGA